MSFYSLFVSLYLICNPTFNLQEGDLLFQDSDCGPFCDAIEKVTQGYKGANLSHIGMAIKSDNGEFQVIEATTKGVVITSIQDFLQRSHDDNGNSKVIVGRISPNNAHLIPDAISHAKSLLGKSYDHIFDIKNDSYYCSELIYEAFKYANNDQPIFNLYPMTFVDPDTKATFGIWKDYYQELNHTIPEGELGLNPGGISQSPIIEIVHLYGMPSGLMTRK